MAKGRYWSVIGYPESLPVDWEKRLKETNLMVVVSPLHDKDFDDDGEPLKPHYHIMIGWDGPVSMNNAQELCQELGIGGYVKKVGSTHDLLNYMTHDSFKGQGKAKYDVADIKYINCSITDFVKDGYFRVIEFIKKHNIHQFNKLVDKLVECREMDLLEFVSSRPYYVNLYLSSLKIDIDKDLAQTYAMLKGYCEEVDRHGKFTIDREHYGKLMELFEQLDIFSDDL